MTWIQLDSPHGVIYIAREHLFAIGPAEIDEHMGHPTKPVRWLISTGKVARCVFDTPENIAKLLHTENQDERSGL